MQTGDPPLRDPADDARIAEVNLSNASDPALADQLQGIPTGLRIKPDQVAHICYFVRKYLARNPQWQQLLSEIKTRLAASRTWP